MPAPTPAQVVLELRVHGVRGTPTTSMLGADDPGQVQQVAGDSLTGFYRLAEDVHPPMRRLPTGMALEAYSWGGLTSSVRGAWGWVTRVLWLGLLPFALVNLAFWARTQVGQNSGQARWGLRAVRVSGLILTMVGILTACFVALDLIAWQCFRANSVACPVLPDWLDALASLSAGRRIVVMSVVPVALVLGLFLLTRQSLARYEATTDDPDQHRRDRKLKDRTADRDVELDTCAKNVLGHPSMWQGEKRTRRLLRLHVAMAAATIVLFTGAHLIARDATDLLWITTGAAGVVALLVLARTLTIDEEDLEYRWTWHLRLGGRDRELARKEHWLARPGEWLRALPLLRLVWVSFAILAAHLALIWSTPDGVDPAAEDLSWWGSNLWFLGLFVALTVVHVIVFVGSRVGLVAAFLIIAAVLAIVVSGWFVSTRVLLALALLAWAGLMLFQWWSSTRAQYRAFAWAGAGASVLLGAATMVALLFTSALTVAAAEYLNGESQSVADLITKRNERSPLSAQAEKDPLTLSGDVVLAKARISRIDDQLVMTSGEVRTDGLSRASTDPRQAGSFYSMASSRVTDATLVLPADATRVRLVASCFRSDSPELRDEVCTGESEGFRTAGLLDVTTACPDDATRRCLVVDAARGRVALTVTDPPQTPLVVPQILVWTPLMQLAVIIGGILLTLAMVALFRLKAAPEIRDEVKTDALGVPRQDREAVQEARVTAALAHRGERMMDAVGAVTSFLALGTLALSSGGRPPWEWWEWTRPFATASLYAALAVSAGLMLAGSLVRRSPSARRNVGMLWDITTFWPRSGHPFGPPCYAERVVPEITARVRWALGRQDDRIVVLSGHSQGSLICVSVVARLNGLAKRVRLLTYGSQVRALYGRVFPAAAGPDALGYEPTDGASRMRAARPDLPQAPPAGKPPTDGEGLRYCLAEPGHWINFFRRSDPLGYRVYGDADGPYDVPTLEVRPAEVGDPGSLVLTHGGYQHTPEYRRVIAEWTGEVYQEPEINAVKADPLPPS
ncbi:hypothetical protein AFL01nite_20410 [Aeromicrobium flavum]|uniref:Integral membrane protein n=1 Tax=Aeromicrobium flavum TaxID=416568 RepID=A0A512HW96_9ACTN|nr:hypothetical protein [Aeromicrobium flavum]GEO89714.1 hypothetical protein AFL01nite_20410 [Aeromicrobium flavum]